MQVRVFIDVLRRRWLSIVVVVVLCTGVVAALAYRATPQYRANAKVYFALNSGTTTVDLSQGSTYVQDLVLTYATLATTPTVLDAVISDLKLNLTPTQLADKVNASVLPNTVIATIQATDPSARRSALIANDVAKQLGVTVTALAPKNASHQSTVAVQTIGPAQAPKFPATPKKKRNIAAAFVGGLFLGVAYAMILELLATEVRRRRGIEPQSDAPVLGEMPASGDFVLRSISRVDSGRPQALPEFEALRQKLDFVLVDRQPKTVVVSSAVASEGKSVTALNLAIASAEAGTKTLLIDANLRGPSIGTTIGRATGLGLSSVLAGRAQFDDVVVGLGPRLHVLTSGPVPPNPGYLLGSQSMEQFLRKICEQYELVVLDSAPVLSHDDTARLVPFTSGILLVTRVPRRLTIRRDDHTRLGGPRMREAINTLQPIGPVLGIIVVDGKSKSGSAAAPA